MKQSLPNTVLGSGLEIASGGSGDLVQDSSADLKKRQGTLREDMHSGNKRTHLVVLMTCFNRRSMTLEALDSLFRQRHVQNLEVTVYLVDDGSSDGTGPAVMQRFPQVILLQGDGSLFWNGGMRKAFAAALDVGFDGYIWFNDDTRLEDDALHRLVACAIEMTESTGPAIVVGSIRDPYTGERSYGGVQKKRSGLRLDFVPQLPDGGRAVRCDTMNGNFTMIPAAVASRLGNLDDAFQHQLADFDYGLRATKAGISIFVAPGYFGYCRDNPSSGTWKDSTLSLKQRWKHLMSPKGAPPREWFLYTRRHFGWRWPLYSISPYLKSVVGLLLTRGGNRNIFAYRLLDTSHKPGALKENCQRKLDRW
jgi:GT2 family glycosyltransferase